MKIEFLRDLDDQPAEAIVTPFGCRRLRAVNLRATGNVERDHREITLDGPNGPVRARIAALAGYLLSKAAAFFVVDVVAAPVGVSPALRNGGLGRRDVRELAAQMERVHAGVVASLVRE